MSNIDSVQARRLAVCICVCMSVCLCVCIDCVPARSAGTKLFSRRLSWSRQNSRFWREDDYLGRGFMQDSVDGYAQHTISAVLIELLNTFL